MVDVIDLGAERDKREAPDPENVGRDEYGRPFYRYSVHYQFEGNEWRIDIWAYSMEEAERRIESLRGTATLGGQVYFTIPG